MCKFSKLELAVLRLSAEEGKTDEIIRLALGLNSKKQVAVHRSNARRKVAKARKFYQDAMREFGAVLFPGVRKKYKGVK